MNKDDGGSAFPNAPLYSLQEEDGIYELLIDEQSSGMKLRDYFAAQAMQALIDKEVFFDDVAESAYKVADHMLKAREQ